MKLIRLAVLVVCVFPVCLMADTVTPIDNVENYVNIRSAPEGDAEVVSRLQHGSSLPHIGTTDGWREVALEDGSRGFVSERWTHIVAEEEPPAARIDPAESEATGDAAIVSETPEPDTDVAVVPETGENEMTEEVVSAHDESDLETEESNEDPIPVQPVADSESQTAETPAPDTKSPETVIVDAGAEVAAVQEESPKPDPVAEPVVDEEQTVEKASGESKDAIAPEAEPLTDSVVASAEPVIEPGSPGSAGPPGPPGPPGPSGPEGRAATASIEGKPNFIVKFSGPSGADESQIYDDGRTVGIGTEEPAQRFEVNGNIQIHARNSSVAGLIITQSSGESGYIMHNRASTLTIGAGSVDRLTIDASGNVGLGQSRPSHPLDMANGAHVTAGGVWTNSSSVANKENIASLTIEEALAALAMLEPVQFNYKNDRGENHVGFIAEDVPDLVATSDRRGLSPMDVVAVLTRIVQEQQSRIEELEKRLDER